MARPNGPVAGHAPGARASRLAESTAARWLLAIAALLLLGAGGLRLGSDRATTDASPRTVPAAGDRALGGASPVRDGAGAGAGMPGTRETPGSPSDGTGPAPSATPDTAPAGDPPPACHHGDEMADGHDPADWATTLLDTTFRLPASYVPPGLVPVSRAGLAGGGLVRQLVVPDLAALVQSAAADDVAFEVQSAYRSFDRQAEVFDDWVRQAGEQAALRTSARPGHSEHQLGTVLDLRAAGGPAPWSVDFAATRHGRWLAANAWRFGFVVSYPPDGLERTCYAPEAWHIRYVGRATAEAVRDAGVTLRAWLWAHRGP